MSPKTDGWWISTIEGERFTTRHDLEAAVKRHLSALPLNRPTREPFLATIVNRFHDGVASAGQRADGWFELLDVQGQHHLGLDTAERYRGGNLLRGHFLPLGDWRPVTVYPWKRSSNPHAELARALREKIGPLLPRSRGQQCVQLERGDCWGPLEYQHVAPTFAQIAADCIALMAPEEIAGLFGYSKFVPGKDELAHCIPDKHPATIRLLELHVENVWEWLCAHHHRGVHG